jgi:protein-tyrosine phosphatase
MAFITETSAYFVTNQCLFGAYPTQHQIQQLEDWGVDIIVNLTRDDEKKIRPYQTGPDVKIIQFIIPDRRVPEPENVHEFCSLVIYLTIQIKAGKKLYIHCKGGHGRSGLLVSSILCYIHKVSPKESFIMTSAYHATRPVHSTKPRKDEFWKKMGSPQTAGQRHFVKTIFQQYNISNDSPFVKHDEWMSGAYDSFLIKTNLGPISGANGKFLEAYRDSLIENIVFF